MALVAMMVTPVTEAEGQANSDGRGAAAILPELLAVVSGLSGSVMIVLASRSASS